MVWDGMGMEGKGRKSEEKTIEKEENGEGKRVCGFSLNFHNISYFLETLLQG